MSKQKIINTIDMISWLRDKLVKDGYSVHDRYDEEPGLPIHLYCTKGEGKTKESLVIIAATATEINKNYFDKLCFCQSYLSLYPYMGPDELKLILVIPDNANIKEETFSDKPGYKRVYNQEIYANRRFGLWKVKAPNNKKPAEFEVICQPITLRNRMEKEFRKAFANRGKANKVVASFFNKYIDDAVLRERTEKDFRKKFPYVERGCEDIARFFNNYIDEAVVGIAGEYPVKFEERNIDRKLLELIANLKSVSYAKELRQIANDYLDYDTDDYSFAKKWIGELWAKYFSISYPDLHERLEPMLKELYPKYRDHFLHQFQVFLLSSIMIDCLIISEKLNVYKDTLSKGWLLTSTFHDFAQAIQKYDHWSKTFFKESLKIDVFESLELKKYYVENTFSSNAEHIISSLGKCFCNFNGQNITENYNRVRNFFYHQITDKKNHGLLSSLSLLKRFEDNGEFHTVILPSATAIAIHDDAIWQTLCGTIKNSNENEWTEKLCSLKLLPKLELNILPLSFLLILCDNIQDWGRHFGDKELEESLSSANVGLKSINCNSNRITIQLSVNENKESLIFLNYKVQILKLIKTLLQSSSPDFMIEFWDRETERKLNYDVAIGID